MAFQSIKKAANIIDTPTHVLRFWETKFPTLTPLKRNNGRRFYSEKDIELLKLIKDLLHNQGYTIKGAVAYISDIESSDLKTNTPQITLISDNQDNKNKVIEGIKIIETTKNGNAAFKKELQYLHQELLDMKNILLQN